jgi:hypothetical protein
MFTQILTRRVLGSGLVDLLTGPHGVDRYTELVAPTWSLSDARARVVSVKPPTPRGVTLTLAPNDAFLFPDIPAHRHAEISVEVREICKRYEIPYHTGRQFGTVVRKIVKLALPPKQTRQALAVSAAA